MHSRRCQLTITKLVENDEVIGTLIETNDRIVSALEMYDKLVISGSEREGDTTASITAGLAATSVSSPMDDSSAGNYAKGKDRKADSSAYVHPDLEELSFGPLGHSSNNLPAPLRPSTALSDDEYEQTAVDRRGSLSDFSDYESSDEETHKANAGPSLKRNYVTVSDNDEDSHFPLGPSKESHQFEDDPFADPFADR